MSEQIFTFVNVLFNQLRGFIFSIDLNTELQNVFYPEYPILFSYFEKT